MTHLENELGCTFSNKSHQVAKCQSKEDLIKMFDVLMEFYEKDKPNHDCAYAQCSKTYWTANKIVDFTNDLAETMVGLSEKKDHVILGFGMFSEKVEIVEEFYIYRFSNFVADVGGSLGLFLGWSIKSMVLSLAEYFNNFCYKYKSGSTNKVDELKPAIYKEPSEV